MSKPKPVPILCETFRYRLIPLYGVRLLTVVTNDVERSRMARVNLFEHPSNDNNWTGLCAYHGFRIGLFFEREELCHDLIAHEVFHATHRVLERAGVAFGIHNHEPFAHLNGWLTGLVYRDLGLMREKVRANYTRRKYLKGEPRLQFQPLLSE